MQQQISRMTQTVPRTLKPEISSFWHHWNLGRYAYFRTPKQIGNARIEPFIIDEERASHEFLKAAFSSESGGRWVPRGEYVKLMKFQRDAYDISKEIIWQTVMSDTPDEMNDHTHPLLHARGRVLIHGLGLGCVLRCVMMKPNVTHIDVVEVDEDVLNIIRPFFAGNEKLGRITFHLGSCVDYKWPAKTRWNYVWHDIWSTIAEDNLVDDSEAEHGISYATLHRKFGNRCDQQGSWAFERAQQLRIINKIMEDIARNFSGAWQSSNEECRLNMLIEATCPVGVEVHDWHLLLTLLNDGTYEHYRKRAQRSEMDWTEAYVIMEDRARRYAQKKAGMIG